MAMLKILSYGNDMVKYPSWPSSVQQAETGHANDIFRENSLNWDSFGFKAEGCARQ